MRISDRMLNRNFIQNISGQKREVERLRNQVSTQKRVSKPSDDPKSVSRIINLSGQFESANRYIDNIGKSLTFLDQTTNTLDNILNEVSRIDIKMTEMQNASLKGNENIFTNELSLSIDSLLDLANQKINGQYIFGGTDYSSKPFDYAPGKTYIRQTAGDISGEMKVKISPNLTQKINTTGAELFGTIVKFDGVLDSGASTGTKTNYTQTVYDVDGNEYTMDSTIEKTADNTYQMTYDVMDSAGGSVFSSAPKAVDFVFDKDAKVINTINGIYPKPVAVKTTDGKIAFNIDIRSLTEDSANTSISSDINQKMDIFNVLLKVKEQISAGKEVDTELVKSVKDFHQKVIEKMSEVGAVTNRLVDNQTMLENQQTTFQQVIADEQQVDVVDAVTQLQYYDYLLQVSYKMSSMILPKSILDYI